MRLPDRQVAKSQTRAALFKSAASSLPSGRNKVIKIALYHTPQAVTATGTADQIVAGRPRQMLIGEFTDDTAAAASLIEVPQLVAGDVAPTTEPQYEEFTYFDGTRASVRNGDSLPTKTWPLKLPDTHPVMVMLFKYEDTDGNTNAEKGQYLAYNVFNPDGGGAKGEFKVNSINASGEGTHTYNAVIAFKNKIRVASSDNPVPVQGV